jgi:Uma2 family endonuclease
MSGGTERRDLAAGHLRDLVVAEARQAGCRTFGGHRLLRVSADAAYHPDLLVICGRAADVHYEDDVELVVEVLSQSTRSIDRREKLEAYRRLVSLQAYVLVEPTIGRIEVATSSGPERALRWEDYGHGCVIPLPYVILDVDAFYDVADRDATS